MAPNPEAPVIGSGENGKSVDRNISLLENTYRWLRYKVNIFIYGYLCNYV